MQLPNVIEANAWLIEYELDGKYHSEKFNFWVQWRTRQEVMKWFQEAYDWKPLKAICVGESRIRK